MTNNKVNLNDSAIINVYFLVLLISAVIKWIVFTRNKNKSIIVHLIVSLIFPPLLTVAFSWLAQNSTDVFVLGILYSLISYAVSLLFCVYLIVKNRSNKDSDNASTDNLSAGITGCFLFLAAMLSLIYLLTHTMFYKVGG